MHERVENKVSSGLEARRSSSRLSLTHHMNETTPHDVVLRVDMDMSGSSSATVGLAAAAGEAVRRRIDAGHVSSAEASAESFEVGLGREVLVDLLFHVDADGKQSQLVSSWRLREGWEKGRKQGESAEVDESRL